MIFIVGYSRSGTKMMNKVLQELQIADAAPEIHFFEQFFDFSELDAENATVLSVEQAKQLTKDLLKIIGRIGETLLSGRKVADVSSAVMNYAQTHDNLTKIAVYRRLTKELSRYLPVDPTPRNAHYMVEIGELIPDAKFIYMIRDPRDCVLSQKRKWKPYWYEKKRPAEAIRLWLNFNPILMAMLWKNSYRTYQHASRSPIQDRLFPVRYEDMIRSPGRISAQLVTFLGVGNSQLDSSFIRSDNSHKWKSELPATQTALVQMIAGAEMRRAGYVLASASIVTNILSIPLTLYYALKVLPALLANLSRLSNPLHSIRRRLFRSPT